jgi:PEGA domain
MARTSSRNENQRPRGRSLLIYGLGFVLLTNVLTVLFVFLLRGPRLTSIAVMPGGPPPVAEAPALAAEPPPATRQVHVTSRPNGAVVRYEGGVQGTTPLTVTLPAGAAGVLSLEKQGYRARSVTVDTHDTRVRVRLYHVAAAGPGATHPGADPASAGTPAGAVETPARAQVTPARAQATPARAPGTPVRAPAPAPRTAPPTAPARAPETNPETTAPAAAPVPAAAANDTQPPAARTTQPKPARRPAGAASPEAGQGPERPAAGTSKYPGPRAE